MQDSMDGIDFFASGLGKSSSKTAPKIEFLFIGELAEKFGLNPRTIRFYERAGLLKPARHGKFRTYLAEDAEKLGFILKMRRLGVSIASIRLLSNECDGKTELPKKVLRHHIEELRKQRLLIERQLEESAHVLAQLYQTVASPEVLMSN